MVGWAAGTEPGTESSGMVFRGVTYTEPTGEGIPGRGFGLCKGPGV